MSTSGELSWAVRESFLRYVRVIAAGTVTVGDGASEDGAGGFRWLLSAAYPDGDGLALVFSGSVHFVAHGGFLDVDLRDPHLHLGETGSALSIARPDGTRVVIATMDQDDDSDDALVPRLTEAGSKLFGGVYAEGTEFAPLRARGEHLVTDASPVDS